MTITQVVKGSTEDVEELLLGLCRLNAWEKLVVNSLPVDILIVEIAVLLVNHSAECLEVALKIGVQLLNSLIFLARYESYSGQK